MVYLKYELQTKTVVSIHEEMPETIEEGFAVALSDAYEVGDEIENLIYVNEVDEDGLAISTSAAKQSLRASEILRKIKNLEEKVTALETRINAT